jgi:hypothetical protein
VKLEDHARKQGINLINSEPRLVIEEKEPNINIITRGGTRIGVDVDNSTQTKISKELLEDVTYDPLVQK